MPKVSWPTFLCVTVIAGGYIGLAWTGHPIPGWTATIGTIVAGLFPQMFTKKDEAVS